jgi:hypothetical protein
VKFKAAGEAKMELWLEFTGARTTAVFPVSS